jgi:hypothetical protein
MATKNTGEIATAVSAAIVENTPRLWLNRNTARHIKELWVELNGELPSLWISLL